MATFTGTSESETLAGSDVNDVLDALAGNDFLYGLLGNDRLLGGLGNDRLDGGIGNDTMAGGRGNDVYIVDSSADVVTEINAPGVDTIEASVSFTLGAYLENLILTGDANLNGTGNGLNNKLTGNSGANKLNGGAGADTMSGGDGSDTYVVDNSADKVIETNALASSGGIDIVWSKLASYTLGANIENGRVIATGPANLKGNGLDNVLYAGAGANVLNGAGGIDTVSYLYAGKGVTVSLAAVGAQATGGSGLDTLLAIENLSGSNFNDTLTGNSGANTLSGGLGADTMRGGNGNDLYYVDHAGDRVIETNAVAASGGVDTVYSERTSYTLGANIENGRVLTNGTATLTGNGLSNLLYAGAGDNVLNGAGGEDTVSYLYATGDVTASLALAGAQNTGASGADKLIDVENLRGSKFNDTLTGNQSSNVLYGDTGVDNLSGGDGNDRYYVDEVDDLISETNGDAATGGVDTVYSTAAQYTLGDNVENGWVVNAGNADLTGNALNNMLYGGGGNNALDGGAGVDYLTGGDGDDSYDVDETGDLINETNSDPVSGGMDTVYSTAAQYTLGDNVEKGWILYAGRADLTGNALNNILYAGAGDNVLDGGAGVDTASYSQATAGVTVRFATEAVIRYLFDNDTTTPEYINPALDPKIGIPAALSGFSPWSDQDGALLQSSPVAPLTDGLQGQGAAGRAVGATSWHDGNAFLFSFDVAAGFELDIAQIDFWEQGSNGGRGFGPTEWTLSINGIAIGTGAAMRGNPGAEHTLSPVDLAQDLTGTVTVTISATGGSVTGATWRIDNFLLTGSFAPVSPSAQNTNGSGADTLVDVENLLGSAHADTLVGDEHANTLGGEGGHDLLSGLSGDDALNGGDGDDVLEGGIGNDHLTGGVGDDVFRFNRMLGPTNVDTLADFNGAGVDAGDQIELDNLFFTVLAPGALSATAFESGVDEVANAASTRIIYNIETGALFYDKDGAGLVFSAMHFATLATHPDALSAGDFFVI
jgi:Ca2+-binding RTX toxin-like protein